MYLTQRHNLCTDLQSRIDKLDFSSVSDVKDFILLFYPSLPCNKFLSPFPDSTPYWNFLRSTNSWRWCCLAPQASSCSPKDEFSSCEDLMSNMVLRVCIWVLGFVALIGNILVIVWRTVNRSECKVRKGERHNVTLETNRKIRKCNLI